MGTPGAGSGWWRIALALALLTAAAVLLVPAPIEPARTTWSDLIAPLRSGEPLVEGYILAPPRRGEEHDVVYVAHRPAGHPRGAARVEVHIVDRGAWRGVAETASFGIAWEVPRDGAAITSTPEEAAAVTGVLYAAISRNDLGELGPVDTIALARESSAPLLSRLLERLAGWRGPAVGVLLATAVLLVASLPGGWVAVAAGLLALGLALRTASADLPFAHDQDVQRMFTGNESLREIATGAGLRDRHPPLYFFVLHAAQRLGSSEAIGRAPAIVAGALLAPALLLASLIMSGRLGGAAATAALAAAVSPVLIMRSREVSEIPLYALIVIAATALLCVTVARATRTRVLATAIAHALALYTYYLAPFLLAGHAAVVAAGGRAEAGMRAIAAGAMLGAPAVALAAVTLFRDWGARQTAAAFPTLAWGDRSPLPITRQMLGIANEAFGPPVLVLVGLAIVVGIAKRQHSVLLPSAALITTAVGIAALSPIARVQAYYATAVLPLALLIIANLRFAAPRLNTAWTAAVVAAVSCGSVPLAAGARNLYVADRDAFMPAMANEIETHPAIPVVTIAHYDKTLLAYYLARANDRPIRWSNWHEAAGREIIALVKVHELQPGDDQRAARKLNDILAEGAAWVIERDQVALEPVARRLANCRIAHRAPTARLLHCPRLAAPPGRQTD